MGYAIQWGRSLLFMTQAYITMFIVAVVFLPWALVDKRGARAAPWVWCNYCRWSARWMVGLRTEVRGEVPTGAVVIAAKHQSFFDIIMLVSVVPRIRFIMKKQILWTPVVGWYAKLLDCVAVDRGKRGAAIKAMRDRVASGEQEPGQLIIYPQGTRVAPGVQKDYKVGVGLIYTDLNQPCIPMACNVGLFWPRRQIYRKPGLAVIEFLPAIEPGLELRDFMRRMEEAVETRSNALMAEAGFELPSPPPNPPQSD